MVVPVLLAVGASSASRPVEYGVDPNHPGGYRSVPSPCASDIPSPNPRIEGVGSHSDRGRRVQNTQVTFVMARHEAIRIRIQWHPVVADDVRSAMTKLERSELLLISVVAVERGR
jgi:hypothetical protein